MYLRQSPAITAICEPGFNVKCIYEMRDTKIKDFLLHVKDAIEKEVVSFSLSLFP